MISSLALLQTFLLLASSTDDGDAGLSNFVASLPDEFCDGGLDIMLLQDTTWTFLDDHPVISRQLSGIVRDVSAKFPDSRFGIADFKDKPITPFGIPDHDYCYSLQQPLTTDVALLRAAEDRLSISGGGDLPEAHYEAILAVLADFQAGWRYNNRERMILQGGHIIVLITDAPPHFAGDFALNSLPTPPSHPDFPSRLNPTHLCNDFDYPSPDQIFQALKSTRTNMVFLLNEVYPAAIKAWEWVNKQINQPDYMVRLIDPTADDLGDKLTEVIFQLYQDACVSSTTSPDNDSDDTSSLPPTTQPVTPSTDEKSSIEGLSTPHNKRPRYCQRPHRYAD